MIANLLKIRCRMQDLNPRPSVYKTAGSVPVLPFSAGFLESPFRSRPVIQVRESGCRCMTHLRAVVAFIDVKKWPRTRLLPRRSLAHDDWSIA